MSKRIYEPPVARDLSCLRASGTGFLSGEGTVMLGVCGPGTSVSGASCSVGTRVDGTGNCSPYGFLVAGNYCEPGSQGSSGCQTGSLVAS